MLLLYKLWLIDFSPHDSLFFSLIFMVSWWWTGWPGMLRFMGLQRVRYGWMIELNWTQLNSILAGNRSYKCVCVCVCVCVFTLYKKMLHYFNIFITLKLMFSQWLKHVSKSCIGKIPTQMIRQTNWFLCSRVQNINWFGFRFHIQIKISKIIW